MLISKSELNGSDLKLDVFAVIRHHYENVTSVNTSVGILLIH